MLLSGTNVRWTGTTPVIPVLSTTVRPVRREKTMAKSAILALDAAGEILAEHPQQRLAELRTAFAEPLGLR